MGCEVPAGEVLSPADNALALRRLRATGHVVREATRPTAHHVPQSALRQTVEEYVERRSRTVMVAGLREVAR